MVKESQLGVWNNILDDIRNNVKNHFIRKTEHPDIPITAKSSQFITENWFLKWKNQFSSVYPKKTLTREFFISHLTLIFLIRIGIKQHLNKQAKGVPQLEKNALFKHIWKILLIPKYYSFILRESEQIEIEIRRIFQNEKIIFADLNDPITKAYQTLVQLETKHSTGEFYTHENLAKQMVHETFIPGMKILDPSCGSGRFLIEAVKRVLKQELSDKEKLKALENIWGIDINPLACLITRTNIILQLPLKLVKNLELFIQHQNFLDVDPLQTPNMFPKFDVVIGNPPWLVLNRIKDQIQKEQLKTLGNQYEILEGGNLATTTEVTTIFIYHALHHFLHPEGIIFFVVPASLATAKQHQRFRQFPGLQNVEIWEFSQDAYRIHHLCFKAQKNIKKNIDLSQRTKIQWKLMKWDPNQNSYIFTGESVYAPAFIQKIENSSKRSNKKSIHASALQLELIPSSNIKVGRLIAHHHIDTRHSYPLSEIARTSLIFPYQISYYHKKFRQGASIVPRNLLFIDTLSKNEEKSISSITPSSSIQSKMYSSWDFRAYEQADVESEYIFSLAKSTGMLAYHYLEPYSVFLPLEIRSPESSEKNFIGEPHKSKAKQHYLKLEEIYTSHKKSGAKIQTLKDRIDYGHALSDPKQMKSFKIIYAGIGSRVKAALLHSQKIIDTSLYYYCPKSKDEGYYLLGYLNSNVLTHQLKLVGSTGANGSLRNIHKHPLHFHLPQYDSSNPTHKEIVDFARSIEISTNDFIQQSISQNKDLLLHIKSLQNRLLKWPEYQEMQEKMDDLIIQIFQISEN